MNSLLERIEQALEECRPYLRADGGDIHVVDIRGDGIVDLQYEGTCVRCPLAQFTLRAGIERTIMHHVPEVKRVECVKAC